MDPYVLHARIWQYEGPSAWHFVTLPVMTSEEIKEVYGKLSPGWGSLSVTVTIGRTVWKTSIFYDAKHNAYLLPIKSEVRRKEKIAEGDELEVTIVMNG